MKIYTKSGDLGITGLLGGARVPKSSLRITAIGEIDELNAVLGWTSAAIEPADHLDLASVQNLLFHFGAELASPGDNRFQGIDLNHVEELERFIDEAESRLPPLTNFVLPGGSELSARLHLSRSICRRAERTVTALAMDEEVRPILLVYLNRLSDWLFVAARTANASRNVKDLIWKKGT